MSKLERKRFISKIAESPLTYVVLIIFAGLFIYSAIGAYKKSSIASKKLEESRIELKNLENQKEKLSLDLAYANSEFGIEKAIREKFNVVKSGEKVIIIVNEENKTLEGEALEKDSFWGFIKNIFGKN